MPASAAVPADMADASAAPAVVSTVHMVSENLSSSTPLLTATRIKSVSESSSADLLTRM